jgi:hypothetical protein
MLSTLKHMDCAAQVFRFEFACAMRPFSSRTVNSSVIGDKAHGEFGLIVIVMLCSVAMLASQEQE